MRTARRRRAGMVALAAVLAAPVGIAAAAGRGGGGSGGGGVLTIALTAHHSRFTPSSVTVPAGATVRFVVRNLDPIDHELIVGGPEVHARHQVGREAHHHGEVPGEVSVPAGGTASTTWLAPSAAAPAVTYACHLPGHLTYGMSGVVVVTPRS